MSKGERIKVKNSILIVDDDQKILDLLELTFELGGFETFLAEDGETAFAILEKEKVDLVILDIAMEGMDGYTVCKRIKANPKTKHVPVIFLTARTQDSDLLKGEESGGDYYITKPFGIDELLSVIDIALKNKS